MRCLHH